MPGHSKTNTINRIVDANVNRAKEGLRVCEEITRFILNSQPLTAVLKKTRHRIDILSKKLSPYSVAIKERKSLEDVGRKIYAGELKRRNLEDVFLANMQRTKESLRVLEEISKLKNIRRAIEFKKIRYGIYEIEKRIVKKFPTLRNYR